MYVLDGVLVGANDYGFLVKAMTLVAGGAAALLLSLQPLGLGLWGVWVGLVGLMVGRCASLAWRYWALDGPLPPALPAPPATAAAALPDGGGPSRAAPPTSSTTPSLSGSASSEGAPSAPAASSSAVDGGARGSSTAEGACACNGQQEAPGNGGAQGSSGNGLEKHKGGSGREVVRSQVP